MSSENSSIARRRLLLAAAATGMAGAGMMATTTSASAAVTIPVLDVFSASTIPRRAFDSRSAPASQGGGRFFSGNDRPIVVDIEPGPILSANYVFLNITVTQTTGAGFLTIYPTGAARPLISCVNWTGSNQTVAAGTMTRCRVAWSLQEPAHESSIQIFCGGGSAHVIVDLTARWRDQTI